jgi:hypothetical protein
MNAEEIKEMEEAIAQSNAGANPQWKEKAQEVLVRLASTQRYLLGNDLDTAMANEPERTHDMRAIGPAMREGARRGVIFNSGYKVRAGHVHGLLLVVWESNLVRDGDSGKPEDMIYIGA